MVTSKKVLAQHPHPSKDAKCGYISQSSMPTAAQLIPAGFTVKQFSACSISPLFSFVWLCTKHSYYKIWLKFAAWLFFIVRCSLSVTDKRPPQTLQQLFPDAKYLCSLHSDGWLTVINQIWRMFVTLRFSFHIIFPPLIVMPCCVLCSFANKVSTWTEEQTPQNIWLTKRKHQKLLKSLNNLRVFLFL